MDPRPPRVARSNGCRCRVIDRAVGAARVVQLGNARLGWSADQRHAVAMRARGSRSLRGGLSPTTAAGAAWSVHPAAGATTMSRVPGRSVRQSVDRRWPEHALVRPSAAVPHRIGASEFTSPRAMTLARRAPLIMRAARGVGQASHLAVPAVLGSDHASGAAVRNPRTKDAEAWRPRDPADAEPPDRSETPSTRGDQGA